MATVEMFPSLHISAGRMKISLVLPTLLPFLLWLEVWTDSLDYSATFLFYPSTDTSQVAIRLKPESPKEGS